MLPRCKIAKFSIVILDMAHKSSHTMFCKYLFWKFESNHERFPIKIIEKYSWTSSFLSTLQACKLHPNQEMNFPAGICQALSRHISNTYFSEPLQTAPSEPSSRVTRIILCMQLTRVTLKRGVPIGLPLYCSICTSFWNILMSYFIYSVVKASWHLKFTPEKPNPYILTSVSKFQVSCCNTYKGRTFPHS